MEMPATDTLRTVAILTGILRAELPAASALRRELLPAGTLRTVAILAGAFRAGLLPPDALGARVARGARAGTRPMRLVPAGALRTRARPRRLGAAIPGVPGRIGVTSRTALPRTTRASEAGAPAMRTSGTRARTIGARGSGSPAIRARGIPAHAARAHRIMAGSVLPVRGSFLLGVELCAARTLGTRRRGLPGLP